MIVSEWKSWLPGYSECVYTFFFSYGKFFSVDSDNFKQFHLLPYEA